MRFLIVFSAALACAAAAPSHLVPFAPYTVQAYAIPAALPTISSGDIQAAAIDAHVKAADLAQEAIDKARLVSDQAADLAQEADDKGRLTPGHVVEDLNVQSIKNVDQEKERLAEGFWAGEEKKWQALDALKTAEAQLDGAVASKATILSKTSVVAPYVAAAVPAVAPIAPVAPVVSGYFYPELKKFTYPTIVQTHPEAVEAAKAESEGEKVEAAVKAAELAAEKAEAEKEKPAEAAEEMKSEADKALAALHAPVIAPLAIARAFPYAGYTSAYPYSGYGIAPVALAQPGFKYASTIEHFGVPKATFFKTQW